MPNDVFMRLLFFLLCATAAVYLSHLARADVAPPTGEAVNVRAYAIDRNWVQVVADIPAGHTIPGDSLKITATTPGYTLGKPDHGTAAGDRYQGEVTLNLPLKYRDAHPDQHLTIDLSTAYTLCSSGGSCRTGAHQSLQVTIPPVAPAPAASNSGHESGVAGLLSAIGKKLGIGAPTMATSVFSNPIRPLSCPPRSLTATPSRYAGTSPTAITCTAKNFTSPSSRLTAHSWASPTSRRAR